MSTIEGPQVGPSSNLAAGEDFEVYVSGGSPDPTTTVIEVAARYAGYSAGDPKRAARAIWFSGGAVVVTKRDGTEETMPAAMAGQWHPCGVWKIEGDDAGCTATTVAVIW